MKQHNNVCVCEPTVYILWTISHIHAASCESNANNENADNNHNHCDRWHNDIQIEPVAHPWWQINWMSIAVETMNAVQWWCECSCVHVYCIHGLMRIRQTNVDVFVFRSSFVSFHFNSFVCFSMIDDRFQFKQTRATHFQAEICTTIRTGTENSDKFGLIFFYYYFGFSSVESNRTVNV